jgi:hypothetical protein
MISEIILTGVFFTITMFNKSVMIHITTENLKKTIEKYKW